MGTEMFFDQFGNTTVVDSIDGVEIWNVTEETRFMLPGALTRTEREVLEALRGDALPHPRNGEDIHEGTAFAHYHGPRKPGTGIPVDLLLGTVVERDNALHVEGDTVITYHANDDPWFSPAIIGLDIGETQQRRLFIGDTLHGTPLDSERYTAIMETIGGISRERSIAHPATKEGRRYSEEYDALVARCAHAGLQEIEGGMFNSKGLESPGPTLVAVHPFYMEYHNSFGNRTRLSIQQRDALMQRYDDLFTRHEGPLVVVEEEGRICDTLQRIRANGRAGDIYFVPTMNRSSSLFPFTDDREFIDLLQGLGVDGLKFVGGHDAGNRRYTSRDPMTGETTRYSGCLRGLANRIEKLGFPAVETIPAYVYS